MGTVPLTFSQQIACCGFGDFAKFALFGFQNSHKQNRQGSQNPHDVQMTSTSQGSCVCLSTRTALCWVWSSVEMAMVATVVALGKIGRPVDPHAAAMVALLGDEDEGVGEVALETLGNMSLY